MNNKVPKDMVFICRDYWIGTTKYVLNAIPRVIIMRDTIKFGA